MDLYIENLVQIMSLFEKNLKNLKIESESIFQVIKAQKTENHQKIELIFINTQDFEKRIRLLKFQIDGLRLSPQDKHIEAANLLKLFKIKQKSLQQKAENLIQEHFERMHESALMIKANEVKATNEEIKSEDSINSIISNVNVIIKEDDLKNSEIGDVYCLYITT